MLTSKSEFVKAADGSAIEVATVTIDGKDFTNCGAILADTYRVGYLTQGSHGLVIMSWDGTSCLGKARIVASWPMPRSWVSTKQFQVELTACDGRTFTGRTMGTGMLWRGRLKKGAK